jgi:hypothetical protein
MHRKDLRVRVMLPKKAANLKFFSERNASIRTKGLEVRNVMANYLLLSLESFRRTSIRFNEALTR